MQIQRTFQAPPKNPDLALETVASPHLAAVDASKTQKNYLGPRRENTVEAENTITVEAAPETTGRASSRGVATEIGQFTSNLGEATEK